MKKILLLIALILVTALAQAQLTVQVIWPFDPGANHASIVRALIDNANKTQNKYQFVFVNKSGAGGIIAANAVLNSTELTLLANSSSFYTAPYLLKESYDTDQFKIITEICSDRPLAVYTKNLNIFNGNKKEVTVGIVPGTVFSLLTNIINRNENGVKILEIPYKGTNQSLIDLLSNNLDANVNWLSVSNSQQDLKILGITGKKSVARIPTFQSQKIKGLDELVVDLFIFTNSKISVDIQKELYQILTSSHNTQTNQLCESDFGVVTKPNFNSLDKIHKENKERWKNLTSGFKPQ